MRKIAAVMTSSLLVALLQGCAVPYMLQDRPSPPAYKAEPTHKVARKKVNRPRSNYRKPVTRASTAPDAAPSTGNLQQLMDQRGDGGGGGGGGGSGGGGW
jgi:hypothetical protein